MSLLLESIKVESNLLHNLSYHKERIRKSLDRCYHSDVKDPIDYNEIERHISELDSSLHKLRIEYSDEEFSYTCTPYALRSIKTLRVVHDDNIDYSEKYLDRELINSLFRTRGDNDDVIIIRNGRVTDTSYCNVAFLSEGIWYTPDLPLLEGTRRAQLLQEGVITTKEMPVTEIHNYESCRLFNAMMDFGQVEIEIQDIHNLLH